jgi:hypothetical protein
MPETKSPTDQLKEWVEQLLPEHRRRLIHILGRDEKLKSDLQMEMATKQLNRLSAERGENWETMSEPEREAFLDQLIREDVDATQTGYRPVPDLEETGCSFCGHDLSPQDLFRIYCSQRRPSAELSAAKLVILDVDLPTATFPLLSEGETLIGRVDPHRGIRPEVDLSIYDHTSRVSRRHARISVRENRYFIEDLGSANGTFVNDRFRLAPNQPHQLANGDVIRIGQTRLRFVI